MRGRTVILVSHHVQLCAPGASYIVALDNGRLQFQGGRDEFIASGVLKTLSQSGVADPSDEKEETLVHAVEAGLVGAFALRAAVEGGWLSPGDVLCEVDGELAVELEDAVHVGEVDWRRRLHDGSGHDAVVLDDDVLAGPV